MSGQMQVTGLTEDVELAAEGGEISVLVVDDDPEYAELTGEFLSSSASDFDTTIETDPDTVIDQVERESVDCIVCDYDMPTLDGLGVLKRVRESYPDLPFILFTGKGSEAIASEAISAGVTDYLQKTSGMDQYTVLVNRIENAVMQFRTKQVLDRVQKFQKLIEYATDVISIVDTHGVFKYLPPSSERILGYEPEDFVGEVGFDYVHPEDRERAVESFAYSMEHPDELVSVEFRFDHPDGWIWLESRARNMIDDPDINGFVVYSRDITDRKERERQNNRLQQFATTVSHDLQNPLGVASGRLQMLVESEDMRHAEPIRKAHGRMEDIIEELLTLAKRGEYIENKSPMHLPQAAKEAWSNVRNADARLEMDCDRRVVADPGRMQQLLENLIANAIEHGGSDVTVRVGTFDGGFYVEDDGAGLPPEATSRVFESGFTTAEDGIGFGLTIVDEIATAHDWDVRAIEGNSGGARFEFTGVEDV